MRQYKLHFLANCKRDFYEKNFNYVSIDAVLELQQFF
jgi:hypothetical protein